jgi:hypothetical protein
MENLFKHIEENGYVKSKEQDKKLWRLQLELFKLIRGEKIRGKSHKAYYEMNKNKLPKNSDLYHALLEYKSGKCISCTKADVQWGYQKFGLPISCFKCKTDEMINLKKKTCIFPGCKTGRLYGPKGGKPLYCAPHSEQIPNLIRLAGPMCKFKGCETQPRYGYKLGSALRCEKHILPGMTNVKDPKCEICGKRATKGLERNKPRWCAAHAGNAKNVVARKCSFEGCDTIPTFGLLGYKPTRCKKHIKPGMFDLRHNLCQGRRCFKRPTFGLCPKKPTHCKTCKTPQMKDVINKRCKTKGCNNRPHFGIDHAIFCKNHKESNMINLCSKICLHIDCNTIPSFGLKIGKPTHCEKHAIEAGMKNVVTKRCQELDCDKFAAYGTINERLKFCGTHAKKYKSIKINSCESCREPAIYSQTGHYPAKRCEEHKIIKPCPDILCFEEECKKCGLEMLLTDKGLCLFCCSGKKRVEPIVVESIKTYFSPIFESTDRIIVGSCSKYRPDIILNGGTYKIIIEVDEYQHKRYNNRCEKIRMIQLLQDLNGYQLFIIRFNPDKYKSELQQESLKKRIATLRKYVKTILSQEKLVDNLMISYMYYDGWSGTPKSESVHFDEIKNIMSNNN